MDRCVDRGLVAHVELQGLEPRACLGEQEGRVRLGPDSREDPVPGAGEVQRAGPADAAGSAGDDNGT